MLRRSGVTLVEVLVAIFVMGIGLIALLTLFPIGMLRMARAIHHERTAQSAHNAHANSIIYNIRNDSLVALDTLYNNGVSHDVFVNPAPRNPANNAANFLLDADPYGESYPVFVDPIGLHTVSGVPQQWVGGTPPTTNRVPRPFPGGALRRRTAQFVQGPARDANILRTFSLWDDMVFEPNNGGVTPVGTPQSPNGITILRDARFSWGYTMRRPQAADKSVVDCAIVVFDKRSLSISPTGTGALSENVYQNNTFYDPVKNTISIDYTNPAVVPPPVRAGDWIMDVTPYQSTNPTTNAPTNEWGSAHAYWYRVVAIEEIVVAGPPLRRVVRYEVQQPIRGVTRDAVGNVTRTTFQGPVDATFGFQGTCVILDGVAEVFEKGPTRTP